jgi:glycosyltransferase involved in cell wall biosynthesis
MIDIIKFTIAIPAYKSKFLKENIDSILCQTVSSFELIIVNDDSPEDIDSIIKKYHDPRILYFKNEKNCGAINVVDNWNICLSYASGEYFVLMGDDDKMEPNYLDEFSNLIVRYPGLDVYHCRSKIIDEKSNYISITEARPEYESVYSEIWHRIIGRTQFISDFMFHTEPLKSKGGFYKMPLAWASDDITAYLASTKLGIANTNLPIFIYRQHSQTITNTGDFEIKLLAIESEKKWINEFLQSNIPKTEEDIILKQMISKRLDKYCLRKKILTISNKLAMSNIYYLFRLMIKWKKIGLSKYMIGYAFIESLKIRKSMKY